ncbi:competence/damage-inducible protein A [Paludibacter sp. 221]|nr:competence/damage-inducible protein A [Paludibacter sp. 221]
MQVEIITIGDEILIGQIVDTNSAWMSAELNKAGFDIVQITSIHDDREQILTSLGNALERADIVLITGGIGPTKDDITKQTLCEFFGTKLVFDESVYHNIERLLVNRKGVMNELTKAQAMVPQSATVIQNKAGTAPITWFEKDGKVVVSMPGVPYEMKQTMNFDIIPRLKEKFEASVLLHKTLLIYGYPESALAIKIADWEDALLSNLHLAYLPHYGIIRLRLSGVSDDVLTLELMMNQQIDKVKEILGDAVVSDEDVSVEELVGKILKKKDLTLATAESCTGGNIAHLITTISGSSAYFKGSVVSYANEVKTKVLGVSANDIEECGAVSKEVVEQMVQGVQQLLSTDVAVATSGIMGPDGGTDEKPVGTVWIAACYNGKVISRKFQFNNQREQNIERATQAALLMVREILGEEV